MVVIEQVVTAEARGITGSMSTTLHCIDPHCNHPVVVPHFLVAGFGDDVGLCPVHAKLLWECDQCIEHELDGYVGNSDHWV